MERNLLGRVISISSILLEKAFELNTRSPTGSPSISIYLALKCYGAQHGIGKSKARDVSYRYGYGYGFERSITEGVLAYGFRVEPPQTTSSTPLL